MAEEAPRSLFREMVMVAGFGLQGEGCLRKRELKRAEVSQQAQLKSLFSDGLVGSILR